MRRCGRHFVATDLKERQALALMDHPNIARIFDAGATKTGRPYFVMELVRGVPLLQYIQSAEHGSSPHAETEKRQRRLRQDRIAHPQ